MAKEKSFSSDIGVTFDKSYWRVSSLELSMLTKRGRVVLQGFSSDATKSKKPIAVQAYEISNDDYNKFFSVTELDKANPVKSAYAFVTTKDEFKDSKDV